MGRIPTALARKRAVDHVIKALRQELSNELDAINNDDNGGQLYLPAPKESAYFRAPPDPENLLSPNADVPVYVYPATDRSVDQRASQGPASISQTMTWQLEVTLACRTATADTHQVDGHDVTAMERLWIRSDLYTGGIVQTVEKYGCDGDAIHFMELVNDQPALFFDPDRRAMGIATARFEITQKTSAPTRRSL